MRICIDTRISRGWDSGTGRITTSLLDKISQLDVENEYIIVTHPDAPAFGCRLPDKCQVVPLNIRAPSLAQFTCLPIWLFKNKIDLLFSTHQLSMPIWQPCRAIGSVLDIIPFHYPDDFPKFVGLYYRWIIPVSLLFKKSIFTISRYTRTDIASSLFIPEKKIRVIHLAAAETMIPKENNEHNRSILEKYGIKWPYILYHGNNRPHKNIRRLLYAFKNVLANCNKKIVLVITGRDVPGERERDLGGLRQEVESLGLGDHVYFTGYIDEEDLPVIYSFCECFAFPSLYEGFGLPVLEAMACGAPVICSNRSSLPEIAGDAAILFNPLDIDEMTAALQKILDDGSLRADLRQRGILQAQKFSWDKMAQEMLSLFREGTHS